MRRAALSSLVFGLLLFGCGQQGPVAPETLLYQQCRTVAAGGEGRSPTLKQELAFLREIGYQGDFSGGKYVRAVSESGGLRFYIVEGANHEVFGFGGKEITNFFVPRKALDDYLASHSR
jgi:hypothetical protein